MSGPRPGHDPWRHCACCNDGHATGKDRMCPECKAIHGNRLPKRGEDWEPLCAKYQADSAAYLARIMGLRAIAGKPLTVEQERYVAGLEHGTDRLSIPESSNA